MFRSHLAGMLTAPGRLLSNAASRFCGVVLACVATAGTLRGEDVRLADCPEAVRQTILANQSGRLDDIRRVSVGDHVLYLAHFDLKGFRDLKLQVRGDGTLQKSVEEIRRQDLPEIIRAAVEPMLSKGAHIEEVEKVTVEDKIHYRVEIEVPHRPDQIVLFDEAGTLLTDK